MASSINIQDWETVVIHKKKTSTKKESAIQHIQDGKAVDYTLKYNSGKNVQHPTENIHKANEDEIPKLKKVSMSLKTNLINARQSKGWTQKELAQRINEKPIVIAQYESGQAIPNNTIINKLEKVLETKIRTKIGSK